MLMRHFEMMIIKLTRMRMNKIVTALACPENMRN